MKTLRRWQLTMALILAGITGVVENATASPLKPSLTLTIHIYNYADVAPQTLIEAERVAAGIFQRAKVNVRWVNAPATSGNNQENTTDRGPFDLSHIWIKILSGQMAERFNLRNDAMGFAPGSGCERGIAFVAYNHVEALALQQTKARFEGNTPINATTGQILAHAVAHEIGHLLLDLPFHSETGIMRGDWDLKDLQSIAYGYLNFTARQAAAIRGEVARRAGQREPIEVGKLDCSESAQ
jgi:hypothetical protein